MLGKFGGVFLCFWILTVVSGREKRSIKLIAILFRHGDRTPTDLYENDPNTNWKEGLGQLTNKGKYQMYQYGLRLREEYGDVLSDIYIPKDVTIISSERERTRMSAECLLAGLFPPVNGQVWNENLLWQPIPIDYLPRSQDNLVAMKSHCRAYKREFEAARNSVRIQNYNTLYKDLFEHLTNNSGSKITNIGQVETLYNTITIEKEHDRELPDWIKKLSEEQLNAMHLLASENLALYSATVKMKRLKGGPLLSYLTSKLESNTTGLQEKADLVLVSGHDLTIVCLMKTMGFEDLLKPDYGASVIFELHRINNRDEIRVFYRTNYTTNPALLNLPFCASPCYLEDFVKNAQLLYPSNWEEECENISNIST